MKKYFKILITPIFLSSLYANGDYTFNTKTLMNSYNLVGVDVMSSATTLPDNMELVDVGDGTLNIETKAIKLEEFNLFVQTTINVKESGSFVVNINLSDENLNQMAQSSIDIKEVMDITFLSNGDLNASFKLENMDINFYASKNGEVKLNMINDEGVAKKFNTPIDSKTVMSEYGDFISTNEFNASDGTLNTEIVTKMDGTLWAKATNSLGETFEISPPSESIEANIEVVQDSLLDSFKDTSSNRVLKLKSIKNGGLKSTYSVRREFSLKDYFARAIDVNSGSDILVIPNGEVTCEQNSFFDGKKNVILTDGSAKIIVDGIEDDMKLNEEYILNSAKNKILNIKKSWNLIAIPVQTDVNLSEFKNFETIWSFKDNWFKNPEIISSGVGFWINSNIENNISFWGVDYKPNFNDLNSSWQLFGTGQNLTNLKSNWDFKKVWTYDNNKWTENPEVIKEGIGFWVLP